MSVAVDRGIMNSIRHRRNAQMTTYGPTYSRDTSAVHGHLHGALEFISQLVNMFNKIQAPS